jgi:hypothetical protein
MKLVNRHEKRITERAESSRSKGTRVPAKKKLMLEMGVSWVVQVSRSLTATVFGRGSEGNWEAMRRFGGVWNRI